MATPNYTTKDTELFWNTVDKNGPIPVHCPEIGQCWEWTAYKSKKGYGYKRWQGKNQHAHRVSWLITYSDIPDNLYVLHKCDNPSCVRPDHLFLGTQTDNMQDMIAKDRAGDFKGIENGMHKLSDDEVMLIRNRYATESISQKELGKEFGVSALMVSFIVRGIHWKHLGGELTTRGKQKPKLTPEQVSNIRSNYLDGSFSVTQLSQKYGICASTVRGILTRKKWKGVT